MSVSPRPEHLSPVNQKASSSGSMLGGGMTHSSATQSCFKCGKHRPLVALKRKRYFGSLQSVCKEDCKPFQS